MSAIGLCLSACLILTGLHSTVLFSQVEKTPHAPEGQKVQTLIMPRIDVAALLAEDEAAGLTRPYRFGSAHSTDIGISNSGTWSATSKGERRWRLRIVCPDAVSLNLIFNRYWLPAGSELLIFSGTSSEAAIRLTSSDNRRSCRMVTLPLAGQEILLVYVEPPGLAERAFINIEKVIHGYRSFDNHAKQKDRPRDETLAFGDAADCENNVKCAVAGDWCRERNSVVRLLVNDGTAWGTGVLINNTAEDFTPYILTAFHNVDVDKDQNATAAEQLDTQNWCFDFKYYSDGCSNAQPLGSVGFVGADYVAGFWQSDFALVQMHDQPYSPHGLHFSGWNNLDQAPIWNFALHHPRGDIMKFSWTGTAPLSSWWWNANDPDTHWEANFSSGTVEPGSSGSPLYDPQHRIIGQLTGNRHPDLEANGGNGDVCDVRIGWYGKFSLSWDRPGSNAGNRLRDWLDPIGSDQTSLDAVASPTFIRNTSFGMGPPHTLNAAEFLDFAGNQPDPTIPPDQPLIVADGAVLTAQAGRRIVFRPGVCVKNGARLHAYINEVECWEGFAAGNFKSGGTEDVTPVFPRQEALPTASAFSLRVDPNPVEENATITFNLPTAGSVEIRLRDIFGTTLAIPVNAEELGAGIHQIALVTRALPAGTYFCTMRAVGRMATVKIILRR